MRKKVKLCTGKLIGSQSKKDSRLYQTYCYGRYNLQPLQFPLIRSIFVKCQFTLLTLSHC